MSEIFMLVEKKKSVFMHLLYALLLFLTVLFAFGMFVISPLCLTFAVLFGALTWLVRTRCTEFEYSYFDGDLKFTKIKSKSKRKPIQLYNMDEVTIIAPEGDQSVYNYENNSGLKVKNLTSRDKNARVYVMVAKGKEGNELVKFEPDDRMLDAMCVKYGYKIKR